MKDASCDVNGALPTHQLTWRKILYDRERAGGRISGHSDVRLADASTARLEISDALRAPVDAAPVVPASPARQTKSVSSPVNMPPTALAPGVAPRP
jgi:hypothetical protein